MKALPACSFFLPSFRSTRMKLRYRWFNKQPLESPLKHNTRQRAPGLGLLPPPSAARLPNRVSPSSAADPQGRLQDKSFPLQSQLPLISRCVNVLIFTPPAPQIFQEGVNSEQRPVPAENRHGKASGKPLSPRETLHPQPAPASLKPSYTLV